MEQWQQNIIQNNIVELIKLTRCNIHLLSILQQCGILSQNDVEDLDLRSHSTQLQNSRRLYEILLTRTGAFSLLVNALKEVKQSGAVEILEQKKVEFKTFGLISIDKSQILGRGKSGTKVFKGRFDGIDVAVKVVRDDPEHALKEVKFLRELDIHDNIVRYYLAEMHENLVYIALELCLVNLNDEIEMKLLNLEPSTILRKCTKGLAFLHSLGVIHRDLKPANILLNRLGQVKISDFGFCKQLEAGMSAASVSGLVGTVDWMAPEIQKLALKQTFSGQGLSMTVKSDIFSLGCVFHYVLSNGVHPFGNAGERQYRILNNLVKMSNLPENVAWNGLILKMISCLPNLRPSAVQVLESPCFLSVGTNIQNENLPANVLKTNIALEEKITVSYERKAKNESISGTVVYRQTVEPENMQDTSKPKDLIENNSKRPEKNYSAKTQANEPLSMLQRLPNELSGFTFADINTFSSCQYLSSSKLSENRQIQLFQLIRDGADSKTLASLIGTGTSWKESNSTGRTVLHEAAEWGNFEALQYFMKLGADINAVDHNMETPLHKLSFSPKEFSPMLVLLTKNGANINARDSFGNSLLLLAAFRGRSPDKLSHVLRLGGNWSFKNFQGNNALHLAAQGGNYSVIKCLYNHGVLIRAKNLENHTPLQCSLKATRNFLKTVQSFVQLGVKLNENTTKKFLFMAISAKRSVEELEGIVKLGAEWNSTNSYGQTILHAAAESGHFEALKYFLSMGANINAKSLWGQAPIHELVFSKENFCTTLQVLVENGADINMTSSGGTTLLLLAAYHGLSISEIEKIIELGGDLMIKDEEGRNVLFYAAQGGNIIGLKYFLGKETNVNTTDNYGQTVLHWVIKTGVNQKDQVVSVLKEYIVDTSAKGSFEHAAYIT